MIKRILDILISTISLILLMPLLTTIMLVILITDGRPVLFRHERVGKNGRLFNLFKFRTMSDSEKFQKGTFEPGNTSRITKTGSFLRKTKLDELPQFLNVLKGEMSIVGPRPEVEKWTKVYPERWEKILKIKPGMTDESSLKYRDEESILAQSTDPEDTYKNIILPEKLSIYEEYVNNQSLLNDLKIILKTAINLIFK